MALRAYRTLRARVFVMLSSILPLCKWSDFVGMDMSACCLNTTSNYTSNVDNRRSVSTYLVYMLMMHDDKTVSQKKYCSLSFFH